MLTEGCGQQNRRTIYGRRGREWGKLLGWGVGSVLALVAEACVLALPAGAQSAPATPRINEAPLDAETLEFPGAQRGLLGTGFQTAAPGDTPGTPCAEVLRGSGTRGGYVLSHGSILPETVRVRAGGSLLHPGRDYWLDPANGTLILAQPVSPFESISVYYRYVEGQDSQRQPLSMPGLQLNFGPASRLGLFYGMTPGNGSGFDISNYGLALNSKFGAGGLSSYSGLLFFSNVQKSNNLLLPTRASLAAPQAPQIESGLDHLIAQNLAAQWGGLSLRANYQDVGQKFAGFQALRLNYAHDQSMLDQLKLLEAEKGMRRLGLGLSYNPSVRGDSAQGLKLDWSQIQDEKGSITQQALGYTARNFYLNYASRSIGETFAHFQGLREAEKAQWEHEKGMHISSLGLGFNFGKNKAGASRGGLDFLEQRFGADGGSLRRDSLTFSTPAFELDYLSHRADPGFTRFADLADEEKNRLALDIRRQFDPEVTPEQVTAKERDQAVKEAGLARTALRARLKLGKGSDIAFNQFAISDAALKEGAPLGTSAEDAIRRTVFTFHTNWLKFLLLNQSISEGFGRLGDLSDLERAQFGGERGLDRRQLALDWQINKTTKLSYDRLQVSPTADAVAAAIEAAKQAGQDPLSAARAAVEGFRRENFLLEAKGLKFGFNVGETAKEFTRAADLALPDADKHAIEAERGFRRTDYTLRLDGIKGLLLDSYLYGADNPLDRLAHSIYKQNLTWTPFKRLTLSLMRDGDLTTADEKQNGLMHTLFTLNQDFGKGVTLNLYRDDNTTFDKGEVASAAKTDYLKFQTDPARPNAVSLETKRIAFQQGKFENTINLNVHAKPARNFSLGYSKLDIDRGDDPSESTDAFDLQWQATKQFAVVAGVSQTDTNNNANANAVSVGLQGEPIKNVTLAAKFDEVHQFAKNTKDVADISISNSKPFTLSPLRDLTITARYASLNDQRKLLNEVMTGRASWKLWKNEFLLDYGGFTHPDGTSTIARTYSFMTDPNPKKWFHGSFLYKVRTMLDGQEVLVRRFTADWKLTRATSFVYTYGTMPEDEKGNITPLTTANVALKHAFRPNLALELYYRLSDNAATKILTRSLGFGLEGKLGRNSKLELAYSKDANGFTDRYDRSDHFRLLYDHQISPDNFLTLSAEFRTHDAKDLVDEIEANLDFQMRF